MSDLYASAFSTAIVENGDSAMKRILTHLAESKLDLKPYIKQFRVHLSDDEEAITQLLSVKKFNVLNTYDKVPDFHFRNIVTFEHGAVINDEFRNKSSAAKIVLLHYLGAFDLHCEREDSARKADKIPQALAKEAWSLTLDGQGVSGKCIYTWNPKPCPAPSASADPSTANCKALPSIKSAEATNTIADQASSSTTVTAGGTSSAGDKTPSTKTPASKKRGRKKAADKIVVPRKSYNRKPTKDTYVPGCAQFVEEKPKNPRGRSSGSGSGKKGEESDTGQDSDVLGKRKKNNSSSHVGDDNDLKDREVLGKRKNTRRDWQYDPEDGFSQLEFDFDGDGRSLPPGDGTRYSYYGNPRYPATISSEGQHSRSKTQQSKNTVLGETSDSKLMEELTSMKLLWEKTNKELAESQKEAAVATAKYAERREADIIISEERKATFELAKSTIFDTLEASAKMNKSTLGTTLEGTERIIMATTANNNSTIACIQTLGTLVGMMTHYLPPPPPLSSSPPYLSPSIVE